MNIKELISYIRAGNPSKVYIEPDEYDKLRLEMSNLMKAKDPDVWAGTSDNVLATYSEDIKERNFLCKGIPIICKT